MTTRRLYCAALAGIFALSAPLALAETDKDPSSLQDQKFVNKAWTINTAEVRLGKLAQSNASNNDVKEFGKHMVEEHEALNKELKDAADKEGDTLPTDLDQEHTDLYNKLSSLSGADFDKAYMTAMIKGHTKAIALFMEETKDKSQATPVEQWAEAGLPKLKMHGEMAQKTGAEVGASSTDDNAAAQMPDQPAAGK